MSDAFTKGPNHIFLLFYSMAMEFVFPNERGPWPNPPNAPMLAAIMDNTLDHLT